MLVFKKIREKNFFLLFFPEMILKIFEFSFILDKGL